MPGPFFINAGSYLVPQWDTGLWTPRVEGVAVAGVQGYADRAGTWTLIGDKMFIDFRVNMNAKDAATAGAIQINGLRDALPTFISGAIQSNPGFSLGAFQDINMTGFIMLTMTIQQNSFVMPLFKNAVNGAFTNAGAADIAATFLLGGTFECTIG